MMNTTRAAINYYVRLVLNGQWKAENIPDKYKEEVQKILDEHEKEAIQSS